MGSEKTGVKTGGFFHLFDWNKKSRKKLFANGNVSPEGATQGTKDNNRAQTTRPCLNEDDDIKEPLSVKGSSEHSSCSSVADEDGNGTRAPGVVARLMGLESLPTVGVSGAEPCSTPLFDSQSLQENCYRKRALEFHIDEHFPNAHGSPCFLRKPFELRPQKLPSSPIERFQTEVLPPRSAKPLPLTHYKLLSPIKNPGFTSGKNATHIMEAAVKILEPGLQANAKGKVPSIGSSYPALEVRDSKESIAVSQSLSRLPESSRRPLESNAIGYLKVHSLNKSWNSLEDCTSVRASPEWGEMSSTKSKGKTVSLAIQAKVNVQRRESSTTSSRSASIHREQDETDVNQPFRRQATSKNKQQKNAPTPGPSGVLKQNNQKQNCLSNKEKITPKSSMSGQQVKKVPVGDANCRKNQTLNMMQGGSKIGYRYTKEDLQMRDLEKDGSSSSTKNVQRKKRLIDRNHQSEKNTFVSTILVSSHKKHVQSSVSIDEHRKCVEESRRNGTDIVSFTFTSPMTKSTVTSQPTHLMRKYDTGGFPVGMEGESNGAEAKNSALSSLGLNISGDALSVLLEQKLRELTSGLESSSRSLGTVGSTSTSVLYPGLISASENSHAVSMEYQKELTQRSYKSSFCDVSDNSFSVNDKPFILPTTLQGVERIVECNSSSNDAHKEPEQQYRSPLSIFEASFSSESCSSSESSDSNNGKSRKYNEVDSFSLVIYHSHENWNSSPGSKICSSVEAKNYVGTSNRDPSGEAEMDFADSASSICAETANEGHYLAVSIGPTEICKQDMEYVWDILQSAGNDFGNMASGSLNCSLDPLLFDQLENKKNFSRNRAEEKVHRLWRKVLFDCVGECLESKQSHCFKTGCRTWAKGTTIIGGVDKVAEEVYKEISSWKSMGDRMVDELVNKDMSSHLGRWVDFEVEAFEAGIEIEEALVSCLIDEMVADFVM